MIYIIYYDLQAYRKYHLISAAYLMCSLVISNASAALLLHKNDMYADRHLHRQSDADQ